MTLAPDRQRSDADKVPFVPLPDREHLVWPDGKGVAFCPVVTVEHYENVPPDDAVTASDVYGGIGQGFSMRPQVTRIGNRDYGHRVGFFRIGEFLRDHAIPATLAIDAMAAERYPQIMDFAREAGWEVVCHGISVNRAISSVMPMDAERAYLAEAKDRVEQAAGTEVIGWYGPSSGESGRSLQLIAEAGFRYDLDWPNDEQPYFFDTDPGLLSLPLSLDLDDNYTVLGRGVDPFAYAEMVLDAAQRLVEESPAKGRYLSFALNPFISGQPWRFSSLSQSLARIAAMPQVWATQPGRVLATFAAQ
jgi:allantoinase